MRFDLSTSSLNCCILLSADTVSSDIAAKHVGSFNINYSICIVRLMPVKIQMYFPTYQISSCVRYNPGRSQRCDSF